MLLMAKLACLQNLVNLAQLEQVSPYPYDYSSYSTTITRARLAGPALLRNINSVNIIGGIAPTHSEYWFCLTCQHKIN